MTIQEALEFYKDFLRLAPANPYKEALSRKNKQPQEEELLFCPFCDGAPIMVESEDKTYGVECKHCHAKGSSGWKNKKLAALAWNRRAGNNL